VSFYEGTTLLGTASLDGTATAVLPISTLNAGVHNITAKYNGDPGVPANTSNTAQLTVTKRTAPGGGPAITVTVNDASRTTTQANPPFTYSAAGQLINGDTYATAISGTPSYSTSGGSTAGTYSITVSGLDSANYTITFVPGTLTVTAAASTTTLAASPASTQYGDPVALTATVTSGATGTVNFYDGSVLLGTGNVSNGIATLTTTTLVAGTHTITAVYNGDATYASSQSNPATVTVGKRKGASGGAALTITVQNASRQYNTADPQFAYVVTGSLVNGDTYATAVTGTPVYSSTDTATSPAGSTFPISVSGLSSANYEIAVVNGTLTIATAPTTTTLTASTASAQYGDPVTLTATVAPIGATGTVLFMNGSTVLGTGTVTNGVATLTVSSLPAGSYTITATYDGDANYSASTSGPVSLTIHQKTGPGGVAALTVTVSNASRLFGQGNPAFVYTVSGALVNGDTYATAIAGVPVYATTAIPLSPAGGYPVSVAGLNSQNYLITFVNATLTVTKDTPGQNGVANITLTSSPNPSLLGQSVIFTATVPAGATGTVQFMEGSTLLGTGTVSGSTATFATSTLTVGTHLVTAVYSGDANYNSATSAVDNQVVSNNLDFTLTLTSAGTQTVIPGDAANYTVQVAPTNINYPRTVTFSATGLPAGAVISFSPSTVAANGGTEPIKVKVQTASQKAALNTGIGSAVLALLMLPLATSRRMRRSSRRYFYLLILVLGGIGASAGLTGCGYNGNGFFGQAPQTYNITITATSGTIQHSVNVTLNVQ
jgi:Big-like domain-containing protein/MBG domain-containing protein